MKLIIHILYIDEHVSTILIHTIPICGPCYVMMPFPSYRITFLSKFCVIFAVLLIYTTNGSLTVSKMHSHKNK